MCPRERIKLTPPKPPRPTWAARNLLRHRATRPTSPTPRLHLCLWDCAATAALAATAATAAPAAVLRRPPVLPRRQPRPPLERALERRLLREPQQIRDIQQAQRRILHVPQRQLVARLVDEPAVARAVIR